MPIQETKTIMQNEREKDICDERLDAVNGDRTADRNEKHCGADGHEYVSENLFHVSILLSYIRS